MTDFAASSFGSLFQPSAQVTVQPFTRQPDGDQVVLGWLDADVFLELPSDAVELLDWLAAGQSVAQAQASYQARYGVTPDLVDLLEQLGESGVVHVRQGAPQAPQRSTPKPGVLLPLRLSSALWSPAALVLYACLALGALIGASPTAHREAETAKAHRG